MGTRRLIVMLDETKPSRRLTVSICQAVFLSRRRVLSLSGRLIPWILRVIPASGRIRPLSDVAITDSGHYKNESPGLSRNKSPL